MNDRMIIYKCNVCKKNFILFSNQLEYTDLESRYIACPYFAGHKDISVVGQISKYGEIKGCMDQRSYYKEGRKIKQKN